MTQDMQTTSNKSVLARLGSRYGVDPNKLDQTLKATAFRQGKDGAPSDTQMMALAIVADQHGLNPFLKEIYAFPDKSGGIVPVVGVDGWARIVNDHAQFDGMEFEQNDSSCTCIIYRKDRSHPTRVTEYMAECRRNTGPWQSHPMRMLRHKTLIQCARMAFSFSGIYDQDEAESIREHQVRDVTPAPEPEPEALPPLPDSTLQPILAAIQSGATSADQAEGMLASKYTLTDEQAKAIHDAAAEAAGEA